MSASMSGKSLSRSLIELPYPRQPFVCVPCRFRFSSHVNRSTQSNPSSTNKQQKRYASSDESLTDRARRVFQGNKAQGAVEDAYAQEEDAGAKRQRATEPHIQDDPKAQQVKPWSDPIKPEPPTVATEQPAANAPFETLDPVAQETSAIDYHNQQLGQEEDSFFLAPTADQVAKEEGYEPATSLDQLESIGGPTGWWEEAWDRQHQFNGFAKTPKVLNSVEIQGAVRTATYEIFTLLEARKDLKPVSSNDTSHLLTSDLVNFKMSRDGKLRLDYSDEKYREAVLNALSTEFSDNDNDVTKEESRGPENEEEALDTLDTSKDIQEESIDAVHPSRKAALEETWRTVPFSSLEIKFAVLRRVTQLTGLRIPDPSITSIHNAGQLLSALLSKSTPKPKLANKLQTSERLKDLANVTVRDQRYTGISKDMENGRWKRVERELEEKGLPIWGAEVTRRRWQERAMRS